MATFEVGADSEPEPEPDSDSRRPIQWFHRSTHRKSSKGIPGPCWNNTWWLQTVVISPREEKVVLRN